MSHISTIPPYFINTLEDLQELVQSPLSALCMDRNFHGTVVLPACQKKIPLKVPQCNSSELVLLLVVGGEPLTKQGMNHLKMNIKLVWK